jgi:hypothetical protein
LSHNPNAKPNLNPNPNPSRYQVPLYAAAMFDASPSELGTRYAEP